MTTFTTLTAAKTTEGSIANWVNRSDLPVTVILTEVEAFIYERLRVREMMTNVAFVVGAGTNLNQLPADFLDPIQLIPYGQTKELPYVHETALIESRDTGGVLTAGTPSRWTVIGTDAVLDVAADTPFGSRLSYFARPAALAATTNETNFLTLRYPALLRAACMGFAFGHMKDSQRAGEYLAIAEKAIQDANDTNGLSRRGQRAARPDGATLAYTVLTADQSLSGSVRNWVGEADLPVELILTEAEAWIYERLRVREMMATEDVSLGAGASTVALPSAFLDPIQFLPDNSTKELAYLHETALNQQRDESGMVLEGTPEAWTVLGEDMQFDLRADVTLTGVLTYYARPDALAEGNDTNFLTRRYPSALRHAILGFAYQHIQDDAKRQKGADHLALAEKAIQDANTTNALHRRRQRAAKIDDSVVSFSQLTADMTVAGSIRELLGKDDIAAELILTQAQAFIYDRLRVREMVQDTTITLDAEDDRVDLPADFLDPIKFEPWGWGAELPFYNEEAFSQLNDIDGTLLQSTPSKWAILGTEMVFDVAAIEEFNGTLLYYGKPDALSASNETNFLTSRYPAVLQLVCEHFGFLRLKDQASAQERRTLAEAELANIGASNDLARRGQYH